MRRRIFLSIMAMTLLVLIACVIIVSISSHNHLESQTFSSLKIHAEYLSEGFSRSGLDYLQAFSRESERITLIAPDGTVLFDSNTISPEQMANHSSREEFQEALRTGEGRAFRASETYSEQTLYYAKLLPDGNVLRVSAHQKTVFAFILESGGGIILLVVAALLIAAFLAMALVRAIMRPINAIDPENPKDSHAYPELRPLIHKIRHQNNVISDQMEQLIKESDDREILRREFTANVSHELKTPLTTISGTAEILKSGMVKSEDIPHFAENIYHEAQRMISLVTDILKLSQLDESRVPIERESVDLFALSKDIAEYLRDEAEKKQVAISVSGYPVFVLGVAKILDEMIYNLCDNAIKYNRPGGCVWIDLSMQNKKILLTVRDNGIGIPAEHQNRIFERFYRVDKSHSREIGGTGLGLSIVKHGAIFHNAELLLESTPGEGTSVTIAFDPM